MRAHTGKESVLRDCQSTLDAIALQLANSQSSRNVRSLKWTDSGGNRSVGGKEDAGKRLERVLKLAEAETRSFAAEKQLFPASIERLEEDLEGRHSPDQSDVSMSSPRLRLSRESPLSKSFSLSFRPTQETYRERMSLGDTGQIAQLTNEKAALERQFATVSSLLERTQLELAQERDNRQDQESEILALRQALEGLRQDYMKELEVKTQGQASAVGKLEEETSAHARTRLELKQAEEERDRSRREVAELRGKCEELGLEMKRKAGEMAEITGKYEQLKLDSEDSLYRLAAEAAKSRSEATEGLKTKLRLIEGTRNADRERYQAEVSRLRLQLGSQVPSEALEGLQSFQRESSKALQSRLMSLTGRLQAQGEANGGRKSLPLVQLLQEGGLEWKSGTGSCARQPVKFQET